MTFSTNSETRVSVSLRAMLHRLFATRIDAAETRPRTTGTGHLSADRLADMGLPAQTEANRRNSWEQGPVPRADLW